jgi:hypothetical protein
LRLLLAVPAGVIVGGLGGAAFTALPLSWLLILPMLVLGLLVGEVMAVLAGRPGGLLMALLGFLCSLFGPLAGAAFARAALDGPRTAGALSTGVDALGTLGLLVVLGAALLSAARAGLSSGDGL